MAFNLKTTVLAGAVTLAGSFSASAAVIDFTDNSVGLTGTVLNGIGYSVQGFSNGNPFVINRNEAGPGALNGLAGENDGIGIRNDEITYPLEWVVITFDAPVTLIASQFLDLFLRSNGRDGESANVVRGAGVGPADASLLATGAPSVNPSGYGELTGLSLKGTTFTFFAGPGTDDNSGDFALASISVAPIPLPAGALLIGTALAGFGLMRRRSKTA